MMIMTVMAEPSLTQCRNYGSRAVAQERSRQRDSGSRATESEDAGDTVRGGA